MEDVRERKAFHMRPTAPSKVLKGMLERQRKGRVAVVGRQTQANGAE